MSRPVSNIVAIVLLIGITGCPGGTRSDETTKGTEATAPDSSGSRNAVALQIPEIKEPLSAYDVAYIYDVCRKYYVPSREGQSGDMIHRQRDGHEDFVLSLTPFKSVLADSNDSWTTKGKFIGIVENSGKLPEEAWNVDSANGTTAAVTCVWMSKDTTTGRLRMRLINSKSIKDVWAYRDSHVSHRIELASWKPKTQALVDSLEIAVRSKARVLHMPIVLPTKDLAEAHTRVAWFTCDETGCCSRQP